MTPEASTEGVLQPAARGIVCARNIVVVILAAMSVLLILSCVSVERVMMAPPHIEGAEFVGSETCADCHEDISRDFHTASHAQLMAPGEHAKNVGCESCHGAGSLHVETGGAHRTILNPGNSPETCFQCHLDMKARFSLPHHHPVPEGHISCSDCHNVHKGPVIKGGGTMLGSANDTCIQCHIAQRGPHVFEHEAIREGCTTCHTPHGSVNPRMLTERNATLCLKCHFQQRVGGEILIGGREHASFLSRGSCWSAGCHEAVHGSQVSSSLRF
jgi:predicted CXXCH cytochrome family protein